ncbi:MAG: nuclear transport factor 2 family protein [Acidimicrobiia bacterium]
MSTTRTTHTDRSATVDRFLDAACAGAGVPADLFAPDVVLDATVPGWRFSVQGPHAVARQYGGWFTAPASLEELDRLPVSGGEVLTYLLTWEERGIPYAAHHCHVLRIDGDGRIAGDRFFCGGRWDAALLAEMAAAEHAG